MIGAYDPASRWRKTSTHEREVFEKLRAELRRGCLVLAVLTKLRAQEHGYGLRRTLHALGLDIEPGTLYPLLRRLELQGLLSSEWQADGKRRKKFYRLSAAGQLMLEKLDNEWLQLDDALKSISGHVRSEAA